MVAASYLFYTLLIEVQNFTKNTRQNLTSLDFSIIALLPDIYSNEAREVYKMKGRPLKIASRHDFVNFMMKQLP